MCEYMNAMIFAAGLGTRLQPLTNHKPKALVDFKGQPLLWHAIQNVISAGVERIVINVHHFADQIIRFINSNHWECEILISDESDLLLDTGGGLIYAKSRFLPNQSILVQNADIVISTNLKKFIHSHSESGNDATLMVKNRNTTRYLLFDEQYDLAGWKNAKTKEIIHVEGKSVQHEFGFCGVHIIEPRLVEAMGEVRPFSIIQAYLQLANNYQIKGYQIGDNEKWFDIGSVQKLKEADKNY